MFEQEVPQDAIEISLGTRKRSINMIMIVWKIDVIVMEASKIWGPFLLTWINFNPSKDK